MKLPSYISKSSPAHPPSLLPILPPYCLAILTSPSRSANEYAQNANRKTIAPADVFKALEDLDFDFKDRLEAELASPSPSPPIIPPSFIRVSE